MEYKIISAWDSRMLEVRVELFLMAGWIPQGGIAIHNERFYQALYKA